MSYQLHRTQVVGGTIEEVFAFFKDHRNLEAITPPWMGFHILGSTHEEVQLGTRIRYRLRVNGLPMGWESLIAEYEEGRMFADKMLKGPYRRWYHEHRFREVEGGVEIVDQVHYELPMGPLGRLAHWLLVRRQLDAIFSHRQAAMAERFPRLHPNPEQKAVAA